MTDRHVHGQERNHRHAGVARYFVQLVGQSTL